MLGSAQTIQKVLSLLPWPGKLAGREPGTALLVICFLNVRILVCSESAHMTFSVDPLSNVNLLCLEPFFGSATKKHVVWDVATRVRLCKMSSISQHWSSPGEGLRLENARLTENALNEFDT